MMIAHDIDYARLTMRQSVKNGRKPDGLRNRFGYSEFLYRFCLSGTSLLIYYELECHRLNRSPEVGEHAPPPRSTTARAIRMKI